MPEDLEMSPEDHGAGLRYKFGPGEEARIDLRSNDLSGLLIQIQ